MAGQPFQTWTPVGRIVQGNPMVARAKKDKAGKDVIGKDGKPVMQFFAAVAFAKGGAEIESIRQSFEAVAQRDFPNGEWRSPVFSRKIIDGDGVDNKGRPNSAKEGFAGHWVLRIIRNFPYAAVDENGLPVTDPGKFKTGHYARFYINVSGNGQSAGTDNTPGLYVDPSLVQWKAYGPEIVGGPDVDELLAQAPAAVLPAGASLTPLASPGTPPAQLPQHPGGYVPPPVVAPAPPPAPPPPAVAPAAPAPPPPAAPAQWPPVGWFAHPQIPGSYHDGRVVKTEAELRATAVQPHTAILGR